MRTATYAFIVGIGAVVGMRSLAISGKVARGARTAHQRLQLENMTYTTFKRDNKFMVAHWR